jgi:hypothetical protein
MMMSGTLISLDECVDDLFDMEEGNTLIVLPLLDDMADTKRTTYTTPKGVFVFPRLTEPDTKFKAEGEYSVKVLLDPDEPAVGKLISLITNEAAACLKAAKENEKVPAKRAKWETKYLPVEQEQDPETGEPTGYVLLKFTTRASGVSKKTGKPWERKVPMFDAKGKPIEPAAVWGGTVGKVAFTINPYSQTIQTGASVSLGLNAVQILDLVTGSGGSAKGYGFGEEDGYTAEDATGTPPFDTDTSGSQDSTDASTEEDF